MDVAKCGPSYGECDPGTPDIIDVNDWICYGDFPGETWDDMECNSDPVDGICGETFLSCIEGTSTPMNETSWKCLGEYGGSDATCNIKIDGECDTTVIGAC